ncbi:MAG: hypothetical protein DMF59_05365 [Acidobacteria bacterium]|nr:MAG: hypothetical protein DMF59_05365 [Acidobacteriota bacterium]
MQLKSAWLVEPYILKPTWFRQNALRSSFDHDCFMGWYWVVTKSAQICFGTKTTKAYDKRVAAVDSGEQDQVWGQKHRS